MHDATTAADAAHNNAAWCDAVCRAHGAKGETSDALWLCREPVPRFYPNLVTLQPASQPPHDAIRALEGAGLTSEWGVKDSFCTLDLAPLGFRVHLDGTWFARSATHGAPDPGRDALRWSRVDAASTLAAWESAWGEGGAGERIFPPALLAHRDVAILAGWRGGAIEAGAVASRTGSCAGLSNLFSSPGSDALGGVLRAAWDAFPSCAIVGYRTARGVGDLASFGFEALGRLRVWLRDRSAPGGR